MASLSRILHMVWKEIVQIRRDRRMFILVMMMPLLELLIFGYVVATDIDHISLAVCDYRHTTESRPPRDRLDARRPFPGPAACAGVGGLHHLLEHGSVRVARVSARDS